MTVYVGILKKISPLEKDEGLILDEDLLGKIRPGTYV